MESFGAAALLVQGGSYLLYMGQAYWEAHGGELLANIKTYGLLKTLLINILLPGAGRTLYRVKHHLCGQAEDHIRLFKQSFTESFTMIGVAGAIIAQIAITGLSLNKLDETHWSAYAAFIVSVIAGCLAVYYSCTMQLLLSDLHGPQEILEWLTAPKGTTYPPMDLYNLTPMSLLQVILRVRVSDEVRDRLRDRPDLYSLRSILRWLVSLLEMTRPIEPPDTAGIHFNSPEWLEHRNPSISAAILLVAPSQLLSLSLGAFLTGQGIYLGKLYGNNISVVHGKYAEQRILITYVVVTAISVLMYGVVLAVKTSEDWLQKRKYELNYTLELQDTQAEPVAVQEAVGVDRVDGWDGLPPPAAQSTEGGLGNTRPEEILRRVDRLEAALESLSRVQAEHLEAQSAILRNLRETTQ